MKRMSSCFQSFHGIASTRTMLVMLTLAVYSPASAQDSPVTPQDSPASVQNASPASAPGSPAATPVLSQDTKMISVELNKGVMIKLDRAASSVVISDPLTADVQMISPKMAFIRGKKIGETTFYAMDPDDGEIINTVIDVTHNISNLERAIKRVAPDSDVSFKTVDGGLVMDGFAGTVAESENIRDVAATFVGATDKVVNMIKTNGSDQVMLRVKIVEMSHNNLKKLGVNLQNITSHGSFGLQVLQGSEIVYHGSDPSLDYYPASDSPINGIVKRNSSIDTTTQLRAGNLTGVVDTIETNGLATILAEPTLTTTTGKQASFLAGGQYPLPVQGQNGQVSVQYQSFGVSLNFTPVVMSKNHMSITIAPEVSTLDFNNPITLANFSYPILNTRKASAVVELGSGDTFVLAGLLNSDVTNTINKTPGLGDLPILGTLFRSTQFLNNQSELVILVTPYIVHPVSDRALIQTPIDGYVPPNDFQLLLNGALYAQEPMNKDADKKIAAEPKLNGDGGFIME